MHVFENMHQNNEVNGLKNQIKQNPIGTSTSKITHDTPLITKNPRPSKGRVPSYTHIYIYLYLHIGIYIYSFIFTYMYTYTFRYTCIHIHILYTCILHTIYSQNEHLLGFPHAQLLPGVALDSATVPMSQEQSMETLLMSLGKMGW
jgi:hypothetical protein